MEIKEISYKDERLGFFADQRKLVQKRYDRLEKQIKSDEPYTSERREFLSDLGRELSFYNDVIEMLENDVVSKLAEAEEKIMALSVEQCSIDEMTVYILNHYAKTRIREVFEKIEQIFKVHRISNCDNLFDDTMTEEITKLKREYENL